jgi:cyclic-di-GMP phosphodiesterase TipF (flagellum assembly factor)
VVDLLDYDVRFGQGFLFAAPRPLRPETATAAVSAETPAPTAPQPQDARESDDAAKTPRGDVGRDVVRIDPPRVTGNAALARRAVGPV